ncbi:hypothetical protein Trydic_g23683 [Trypoxylus dichotomus]
MYQYFALACWLKLLDDSMYISGIYTIFGEANEVYPSRTSAIVVVQVSPIDTRGPLIASVVDLKSGQMTLNSLISEPGIADRLGAFHRIRWTEFVRTETE